MHTVYALVVRELKRYFHSKVQILTSLGQPAIYLFVLGFGLDALYRKTHGGSYLQFIAPGMMAMTVMFSATISGMTVLIDRKYGFLKGTLVAPVSRAQIAIGRTSGGAIVATLQGLLMVPVCLIAGFRPVNYAMIPVALLLLLLTAYVFSALGTLIGATLKNPNSFQPVINFILLPAFLLSGAMFPLAQLPPALAALTGMDPLTYGVDGLRAALSGETHFGLVTDILVLSTLVVVLIILGTWRISKIEA